MAGSLLDNEDFSSIGSSGGGKSGGSGDKSNLIKIGVIVLCLGVAGFLIAKNQGLIMKSSAPTDTRTQQEKDDDEKQFQQQERVREKMKTMPEYQQGDA